MTTDTPTYTCIVRLHKQQSSRTRFWSPLYTCTCRTAALHSSTLYTDHCKRATVVSSPSCSWCPSEHQTSVWGPQTCSDPCLLRWWVQCRESWAQEKHWRLLPGGGKNMELTQHCTTLQWTEYMYISSRTNTTSNSTCTASIKACHSTQETNWKIYMYVGKPHLANEHLADLIVSSRGSLHQRSQTSLSHMNTQWGIYLSAAIYTCTL